MLLKILSEVAIENFSSLDLTPAITYQGVMSENPNYKLPEKFKAFYGLI